MEIPQTSDYYDMGVDFCQCKIRWSLSENPGHATVAFTLDVYGHVTDQMKKDSADRMQRLISSL